MMVEADKRGILPPDQKAMLDEARTRGLVDKPAVVSAGEMLRDVPRQVGLTARYGAEGLADLVDIGAGPIRSVINPALHAAGLPGAQSTRQMVSGAADAIGLPTPQGPTERVVGDATRLMAGGGGLASGAQRVSQLVAGPVAKAVSSAMGSNVGTQVASGAGAGVGGGSVREAGGGPAEQFVGSLAGGLSAAGLSSLAVKAYDGISNALKSYLTPKSSMQQINVTLNEILQQNGVDVSKLSNSVRADLAAEVKKSLDTGQQLNPDVVRRIADYGVVGATPTRGTVTLDPVQITQEQNLAKAGANSSDPRLQELARVKNANNSRLIENLNEMGAGSPNASPIEAGRKVVGAIGTQDAAQKAAEKALYAKARDSSGRALELDREGFVFDAYNKLAESNKGAFLPDNIKTVLEQLRTGKTKLPDGREVAFPFTVDTIDNIKTMLATAQRGAADGNVKAALSQVRTALDATQPKAVGRPVGGNQVVDSAGLAKAQGTADASAGASMEAFDKARAFAKARRDWQESSPGIAAALDDAAPDRFVKDYIISNNNKSATFEVEKLIDTVRKDPEALKAVKENVVGYLKSKALSGAADEVGNFSPSGFNKAMNEIGDLKLKLFFTKDELAQLKAVGRVSSYETVQPRGSAVNNSNTAGSFAGLLDKIASNPILGRIPFGDVALRQPAKNWSAQIGVKTAMDPYGAAGSVPQATSPARISDLLGPGLLLASPKAESRNNEKRR